MADKQTQLVVLGGGPGGYAAAFMAADLGLSVTLVDPEENPGGVCLYRGCIPSKALLHVAKVITEAKEAASYGIRFSEPKIDLTQLRDWKNEVVTKLTGGLGQLAKNKKVDHIRGKAKFVDNRTLSVTTNESDVVALTFEHAIIATGSHPISLPGMDIDSGQVWNSTDALNLDTIPKKK